MAFYNLYLLILIQVHSLHNQETTPNIELTPATNHTLLQGCEQCGTAKCCGTDGGNPTQCCSGGQICCGLYGCCAAGGQCCGTVGNNASPSCCGAGYICCGLYGCCVANGQCCGTVGNNGSPSCCGAGEKCCGLYGCCGGVLWNRW